MKDQSRKCMFCDGRASTKEDAWPLWLVRKFPDPLGVAVEAQRKDNSPTHWRQRGHFAKAKVVCKSCNNEWMSQLEDQAKPLIERLLSNARSRFNSTDREVAARWVLKTAMVFEAVGGSDWFYTADERATVRSGVIPGGYTAFWVAQCANLPGAYSVASNMFESAEVGTSGVHGYVTTLAISNVAFQVLTVRPSQAVPANAPIELERANLEPWPQAALQLWPPLMDFHWPPSIGLNGESGVEAFSKRFREPSISAPAG